jgi:hypothetical protein
MCSNPDAGKTAVGLHRAAYLLFTHRDRLRKAGVLVVGPNRSFLSYIGQVLPALGEVDVTQSTIDDLVAGGLTVRSADSPAAAAVKGDARMADVLRRALYAGIAEPTAPVVVPDGPVRRRIGVTALARLVELVGSEVRAGDLPYSAGRERLRARVAAALRRQAERHGDAPSDVWLRRVARSQPVRAFLDACWPAADPPGLVAAVLGDRSTLAEAADGVLSGAEQEAIAWPAGSGRPRSPRSARWSAADLVLIDEARGLLDRVDGFGHVVLDEAQDLTQMQCRAVARRFRFGSVTALGDLAQATAIGGAAQWPTTMRHLGRPDAHQVSLTLGYRVPTEIIAFANRLLPALDVDVEPARSLRRAPGSLTVRRVGELSDGLVAAVLGALAAEGSVGVLAADARVAEVGATLTGGGVGWADPSDVESGHRVAVVPASLAKGLEFDHVVVAEPTEVVAAEPRGLHRLYVLLTRAVTSLAVVHTAPLPDALTGPSGRERETRP